MENPNLEIKHRKLKLRLAIDKHVVGLVSAGNMLGVEETCLGTRNNQYTQTVICASQNVELYKVCKDHFTQLLRQTITWKNLLEKSSFNVQNISKSIQQKQLTNLRLIDSLKLANSFDTHEEEPSRHDIEDSPKAKNQ